MSDLIAILVFVSIFFAIWAIFGHLMWMVAAWIVRKILGRPRPKVSVPGEVLCSKCAGSTIENFQSSREVRVGEPSMMNDLAAFERQINRFFDSGKLDHASFVSLLQLIQLEQNGKVAYPDNDPAPEFEPAINSASLFEEVIEVKDTTEPVGDAQFLPSVTSVTEPYAVDVESVVPHIFDAEPQTPQPKVNFEPPSRVRKPFSEVLNAFMEESNIRWGELIGGLLIIGCSTALTVSLWSEISRIPVLKFLIFTTVTAILFGVGLYTEHRWKLPTTSRGILTIATLLVPLNFLAIAAVSSTSANGGLVIASELVAPGIFLCLVYFAGRTITPGYAHLLSAGILGSSVGQLLVRHFATTEASAALLLFLGSFPVACYAITVGLVLRGTLRDHEVDEQETNSLFTVLGTMSFAALLPFGLLLYRSGPIGMTMMYLAPLVTVWGLPMLATGTVIWRRVNDSKLVASRTAGTALGILGAMIVLVGMVLAWPNPASIVPTAMLNFAIFTALAIVLEMPVAHTFASLCASLAYLVTFHVVSGNIRWENLRVMSLLRVSLSDISGEALVGMFLLCLVASEGLTRLKRDRDGNCYLASACGIAVISLLLVTLFSVQTDSRTALWAILGIYSLGSTWIAWRRSLSGFGWIGSVLLLFSLSQSLSTVFDASFPWQTAFFVHATICAAAAIVCSRFRSGRVLTEPLNASALISSTFAIICLVQGNPWQVTSSQATRIFWLAGILLTSLWLNRSRILFTTFQIALTVAFVFTVKGTLQQYDWYAYLPHAFMHPWGLQIQLTVLLLLSLLWISVRLAVRKSLNSGATDLRDNKVWLSDLWRLLDSNLSVDQTISWIALPALLLLSLYGAASGLTRQLTSRSVAYPGWDIAGFPHWEALGLGSWIVLGLLAITMFASWWERRRDSFLFGAVATLGAALPLIAGRFELQIATATAWCWLAALFFATGSFLVWSRDSFSKLLNIDRASKRFASQLLTLLLVISVTPILVLTIYPALRAVLSLPLHQPESGFFSLFSDKVLYAAPLVVSGLALIGHAVRERRASYAMAAGTFFNLSVTVAYLISLVASGVSMNRVVLIELLQLNSITFAVYGMLWLFRQRRWSSDLSQVESTNIQFWFRTQELLPIILNVSLVLPALLTLVFQPQGVGEGTFAVGSVAGWLSLALSVGMSICVHRRNNTKISARSVVMWLLLGVCLVAVTASQLNVALWTGLHALLAGALLASLVLLFLSEVPTASEKGNLPDVLVFGKKIFALDEDWRSQCRNAFLVLVSFCVFLAIRIAPREPSNHWWPIGSLLAVSAMFALLNSRTYRRRYIYVSGMLFNLAAFIFWVRFLYRTFDSFTSFVEINVIAATLSSLPLLYLELRSRKKRQQVSTYGVDLSYHSVAGLSAIAALAMIVWSEIGLGPYVSPNLIWLSLASTLLLSVANLWDERCRHAVAALYLLGLIIGAICLQQLNLTLQTTVFLEVLLLSVYAIATSLLTRYQQKLLPLAEQLRMPVRVSANNHVPSWLSVLNVGVVTLVTALAFWLNLNSFEWTYRVGAAAAVVIHLCTFLLLANGSKQKAWHKAAFAVAITGITLIGWTGVNPWSNDNWVNRAVITSVIFILVTVGYSLWFRREGNQAGISLIAVGESMPWVMLVAILSLMYSLASEISDQITVGVVDLPMITVVTIAVTMITIALGCITFALWPNRDPLRLSDTDRAGYVYFAEVMIALLFTHMRLTLPWLFTGFFTRYWPLVVMAIAYFGVIASETLRRQKMPVLSKPIEHTGAFLPLLPVLGFWLAHSQVDYSLLLLAVGGLYGLLSVLRRSFVWGALAAVAANGGLWYWLQHTSDYQFLQHPQLWLIPVASSVLIAAHLNDDKLSDDQITGLRYLSLVTIYVSSTADIFVNGVANSPWLPLILGALSLCGVFSGILLRVRGLLLLGSVFLLLSITTMIWYASANLGWTWLWYVAGIATGASIIFMFAIFEKKRSEILRVVEGFRDWDR